MNLVDRATFTQTMVLFGMTTTSPNIAQLPYLEDSVTTKHSSASSVSSEDTAAPTSESSFKCTKKTCTYHPAPLGVDYDKNDTVFGKILRGDSPATALAETSNVFAFEDIHPWARLHGLVIPKRLIKSVFDLTAEDQDLLDEMRETAYQLLREQEPTAYARGDFILCFHVPPYNSVDHLHLHVMAPKSKMRFVPRFYKYNTNSKRAASLDSVQSRLQRGKAPVPYKRPQLA